MSIVKISQLPPLTTLSSNTANTLFVAVDLVSGGTGKVTAKTLARGLYINETLDVGVNPNTLPNTVAQFALGGASYIQTNLVNTDDGGSADIVVTANAGSGGTDSAYFIDMGFANKSYQPGLEYNNIGTAIRPRDGYLYVQGLNGSNGGNLIIGTTTTNTEMKVIVGGGTAANVVAIFTKTGLVMNTQSYLTFADGTRQTTNAATYDFSQSLQTQSTVNAANIAYILNVNLTQNTLISAANTLAQNAYGAANTAAANTIYLQNALNSANANITYIFAVNASQNTLIAAANTLAQNAYNKANNAIANTNEVITAGNFNISGNLTVLGVDAAGLFTVNASPQVANTAAFTINGANGFITQTPLNQGYMLHVTGFANTPTRIVADAYGANTYPAYIGRAARGSSTTPAATQNNDILMRITGNGWGSTGFSTLGVARIDVAATQNYTDSAKGSRIDFWNTRTNSNTLVKIASFNADSVEFTGSVTPEKGFIWVPRNTTLNTPTVAIDFANDSVIRVNTNVNLTASLSSFVAGKVVEMWVTNTHTGNRTFTHGVSALNSTVNDVDYTVPATSTVFVRYLSFGTDSTNTFVSIVHA